MTKNKASRLFVIKMQKWKKINIYTKAFGWIVKIWLDIRSGKVNVNNFIHGSSFQGLNMPAYTLFFTFIH